MSEQSATKKCPFCAEEIQAAAVKCRYCGSDLTGPLSAKRSVQTIEQTSKRIKLAMLIGVLMIIVGVISGVIAAEGGGDGASSVAAIFFFVGLILVIGARFEKWWKHE